MADIVTPDQTPPKKGVGWRGAGASGDLVTNHRDLKSNITNQDVPDASIIITENGTENTKIASHRQMILQIHRSQSLLFGHHRSQTIPLSQVTDYFQPFHKSQT